jgi:SAM-dependent methyltransferase
LLSELGYDYINIDLIPVGRNSTRGDAHRLPFCDNAFDIVVSDNSLEHFRDPCRAVAEARRVLSTDGRFVIAVPFMHPFHGNDYWRYTPLGLEALLGDAGFRIVSLEAPEWILSVIALAVTEILKRVGLRRLGLALRDAARRLDQRLVRFQGTSRSFAQQYVVVALPIT